MTWEPFAKKSASPSVPEEPVTGPSVPEGSAVYAIGDIHGEAERLDRLHAEILADADARDAARRVAVYVGDYVDRGPDSAGVIERLIAGPLPGFEIVYLMGNHEEFLLKFLETGDMTKGWFVNGGVATLESYDVDPRGGVSGYADPVEIRDRFAAKLPDAHVRFLNSLVLHHVEGNYLFVHAGIRPGCALEDQSQSDLLWIRQEFLDSDADHSYVVVHGHTPCDAPETRPNRIGIDTGVCHGGPLTALVLQGQERAFLQV